jgi:hypothetical protein
MLDIVQCDLHGETPQTFVCTHLKDESYGLGFNREEPSDANPYPDAWCDACEVVRLENNGWDNTPDELFKIVLLCAECYERSRIRNTHPSVSLSDLAGLRWKCRTCDEWHTGPCLDFGYSEPYYWTKECEKASRLSNLLPRFLRNTTSTFLDSDYCSIDGHDFFVRGLIHIPIIGAAESLRWGVWGSLSRENFETLLKMDGDVERVNLKPMFSWLSTNIPEYGDTLSLKMYAHIQEVGTRPHFWIERSDHPLSLDFHRGITPERVKQIMVVHLPSVAS